MAETPLRLDAGPDHDERGVCALGGVGDGASKLAGTRSHDLSVRADPIALGQCPLAAELDPEHLLLGLEVRIEGQLPVDEERRQQEDVRAPIGGKPAGQVQRMPGVLLVEQRDDDHPGSTGEAASGSAQATVTPTEPMP